MSGRNITQRRPSSARGTLPPKEPGRHRWMALAWHSIADTQAAAAHHGARLHFRPDTMVSLAVGCADCQTSYDVAHGRPCPAGDVETLPVSPPSGTVEEPETPEPQLAG